MNIGVSITSKIILMLVSLYMRRLLIVNIGNEVNGLNSLYGSIIGFLSVAELGVGSAISFSMYKPIVEGDNRRVAALHGLYRRIYFVIGVIIFATGLAVMPFLPGLIGDYENLNIDVYSTFLLTLISVVLSYLYSARTSLIEAYKNNYIITGITTVSRMLKYGLQIVAVIVWKSYVFFLVCQILETLLVWCMTETAARKLYPQIICMKEKLDPATKAEVSKNVRAMFMHKIGALLIGAVDSTIISAFIGVAILGKYTNYTAISSAMAGVITLFFTPLTAVIGHLCVSGKKEEIRKSFYHFYSLNFILGIIFFLGYFAVADSIIVLFFGEEHKMGVAIPFIVTLNQFILYMRYAPLLFRDASGSFYYDRWKPLAEGVINLVLSIFLVVIFPEDYKIAGVIVATILTTLMICDTVEPHILYKYVFEKPARKFYITNYGCIVIFVACLFIMEKLRVRNEGKILEMITNGFISLCVSGVVLFLLELVDRSFKRECKTILAQTVQGISRLINRKQT